MCCSFGCGKTQGCENCLRPHIPGAAVGVVAGGALPHDPKATRGSGGYLPGIWAGRQWLPPRNYWRALLAGFPGLPAMVGSSANEEGSHWTRGSYLGLVWKIFLFQKSSFYVYVSDFVCQFFISSKEWSLSSCCHYHQIIKSEHLLTVLSYLLWLVPWVSSSPLVFLLICALTEAPSSLGHHPFMNIYFLLFSFPEYHPYLQSYSVGP